MAILEFQSPLVAEPAPPWADAPAMGRAEGPTDPSNGEKGEGRGGEGRVAKVSPAAPPLDDLDE